MKSKGVSDDFFRQLRIIVVTPLIPVANTGKYSPTTPPNAASSSQLGKHLSSMFKGVSDYSVKVQKYVAGPLFYLVQRQKTPVNMMLNLIISPAALFALLPALASQAAARAARTPVAHDFMATEDHRYCPNKRELKTSAHAKDLRLNKYHWLRVDRYIRGRRLLRVTGFTSKPILTLEGRARGTHTTSNILLITAFKDREVASHVGGNFICLRAARHCGQCLHSPTTQPE
jgi:hypothetical protein